MRFLYGHLSGNGLIGHRVDFGVYLFIKVVDANNMKFE